MTNAHFFSTDLNSSLCEARGPLINLGGVTINQSNDNERVDASLGLSRVSSDRNCGWNQSNDAAQRVGSYPPPPFLQEVLDGLTMSGSSGHTVSFCDDPMSTTVPSRSLSVPPGFTEEDRYRYSSVFQYNSVEGGTKSESIVEREVRTVSEASLFNNTVCDRFFEEYPSVDKNNDVVTTLTP